MKHKLKMGPNAVLEAIGAKSVTHAANCRRRRMVG
jgi:hypothetical protein